MTLYLAVVGWCWDRIDAAVDRVLAWTEPQT